ncbi:hypothetical protein D3C73_1495540 [compost metagenome]
MCALFSHSGLVAIVVANGGFVVVTHEQSGITWQLQQPVNRTVQLVSVATGKVAAGGAAVGHEQGVANERRIFDQVAHASRRMAGGVQYIDGQ